MKVNKLTIVLIFVAFPMLNYAQSQFDKFEDFNGVTSIIVNQKAFSLMSEIGSESDDAYLSLIKNINSLKVFTTENKTVAVEMAEEVNKYLENANLEVLIRGKEGESNVAIYVKEAKRKGYVNELFMFVKDNESSSGETIIVSLIGNIDLKQVAKLTEKMSLPGGDHLKKASE